MPSFSSLIEAIKVPRESPGTGHEWSNEDLRPSPIKDRKWNKWVYLAFWTAHAAGAGSWTSGSAVISLGLSPFAAWITLATSHLLITGLIVLNGRGPARYHVGFPMMARVAYGLWGSYLAISMRAVVCVIWNGTNAYYGSH